MYSSGQLGGAWRSAPVANGNQLPLEEEDGPSQHLQLLIHQLQSEKLQYVYVYKFFLHLYMYIIMSVVTYIMWT